MSYIDENTRWRFRVPQAGEVDSAENVERRMVEIDQSLIGPMNKAELLSNGVQLTVSSYVDNETSKYSTSADAYWSRQEGRSIYVTRTHYHPTPNRVPNADHADEATHALNADDALRADWARTATTQTWGTDDTTIATTAYVNMLVSRLTDGRIKVKEAEHADDADNAVWAENAVTQPWGTNNKTIATTEYVNMLLTKLSDGSIKVKNAEHADNSNTADYAQCAGYLKPGFKLNGKLITGKSGDGETPPEYTIKQDDIPDQPRVYWGTKNPTQYTNIADATRRRKGDIFVKII